MLDQVLSFFDIIPDYDLTLMKPNQNLYNLTSEVISGLKPVLESFKPGFVYVHGDTTTTMAASIAGFYSGAKICHVEAGLRTNNLFSPFPEEMNRQVAGRVATYHFAPTQIVPIEKFDAIVLTVSHNEFLNLDFEVLKNEKSIIYDVKNILDENVKDSTL
jgi:UDP-N-acetylglucosamine 2-epimerase